MFDESENQIDQILNIVKLASVSFPAIAFLQYFSVNYTGLNFSLQSGLLLWVVLSVILVAYMGWTILQSKISDNSPIKKWMDPAVSLSFAFLSVMLTGSYASSYKFLFLFVIISSAIECSKEVSIGVSGLSAAIILSVDLIFAPPKAVNTYFESDIVLTCVFLILSWTIGYYVDLKKKHVEYFKNLANIDGLTNLYNHRYFYDLLSRQINVSKHNGTELSLLFIDIDDFKYYNDLYGHLKGDEVLTAVAQIMKNTVSDNVFIARYGGEEFAILFPQTGEDLAIQEAEKLRKAVQEHSFEGQENLPDGTLTISVGVSTFPSKAKSENELLKRADEACYRAKFLYKNRVEAYNSILDELQNNTYVIDSETITSIKTLIAVINAKDKYTYGHVERVVFYSKILAEKLELSDEDKKKLIYSAYLHDIGKINVSEDILMKVDPLTGEEWELLKKHPKKSVEIIQNIQSLRDMVPIILHHHERYDGTGYPDKLKGAEIDYLARALSVVDSFDAMTSVRPYQQKKSYEQAVSELIKCSGAQFDPEIVSAFVSAISKQD